MRSREEIEAEIERLERLLKKRKGQPGFTANVAEIETRLEAVKAEMGDG